MAPLEPAPEGCAIGDLGVAHPPLDGGDGALARTRRGGESVSEESGNADGPPVQASRGRGRWADRRRLWPSGAGLRDPAQDAAHGVQQYGLLAGRSGA
jgi:hypothetical protein